MVHFSLLGFIRANFAMFRDALVFSELQLNCKRWWFSETNNEEFWGTVRQRRVKNQIISYNEVCKESCFAHCHILDLRG